SGDSDMFKRLGVVMVLAFGLGLAATARAADPVMFDLDGNTGTLAAQTISGLDWNVGNAVAIGVGARSPVGTTFQLYYQANLSLANVVGGGTITNNTSPTAGALDSLTLVIGFRETILTNGVIDGTGTNTITFGFVPGGNNFFQVYANTAPGNNLT